MFKMLYERGTAAYYRHTYYKKGTAVHDKTYLARDTGTYVQTCVGNK